MSHAFVEPQDFVVPGGSALGIDADREVDEVRVLMGQRADGYLRRDDAGGATTVFLASRPRVAARDPGPQQVGFIASGLRVRGGQEVLVVKEPDDISHRRELAREDHSHVAVAVAIEGAGVAALAQEPQDLDGGGGEGVAGRGCFGFGAGIIVIEEHVHFDRTAGHSYQGRVDC